MEKIIVDDIENLRIDLFLMKKTDITRSKIQKLIKNGKILVNGNKIKNSYCVKENDIITIEDNSDETTKVVAEKIDLDIVYEDDDIIVVNKENGMVVHPATGNNSGTLVNALLYHSKNLSKVNGELRPGIVHRIDAFTTGLLVVAKNDFAHEKLAKQLEEKITHRKYIALVWGVIKNDTGTIDAPIGRDLHDRKKLAVTSHNSKDAVTHFRVLARYKDVTLIEVKLETGRTHQIRVHMNYIGYPVVNDPVYGRKKLIDKTGQCLHAKELGFIHPRTGEYVEFTTDLPEKFINILNQFE